MSYQIKKWVDPEAKTEAWELWKWEPTAGYFQRGKWSKLSTHMSEKAAQAAMHLDIGGQYTNVDYYDSRGCIESGF